MKTMQEHGFLADAGKAKLTIDSLSGEELRKLVAEHLGMPDETKARLEPIHAP